MMFISNVETTYNKAGRMAGTIYFPYSFLALQNLAKRRKPTIYTCIFTDNKHFKKIKSVMFTRKEYAFALSDARVAMRHNYSETDGTRAFFNFLVNGKNNCPSTWASQILHQYNDYLNQKFKYQSIYLKPLSSEV